MKKSLFFPTLFFVSTLLSTTSSAAQVVHLKCLVRPPQAERGPIKTRWNGIVKWRRSVGGVGRWVENPFLVPADGFKLHSFARPSKKGIELQAIITILGWPFYQDSSIYLYWEGGAKEPDVDASRNSEVERIGVQGDIVVYGVIFNMK